MNYEFFIQVSDDGVLSVCDGKFCDCLRELHLAQCARISDESVKAVAKSCPNMQILIFHGCINVTEVSTLVLEDIQARSQKKWKHVTWTIY